MRDRLRAARAEGRPRPLEKSPRPPCDRAAATRVLFRVLCILFLPSCLLGNGQAGRSARDLPDRYRAWLQEEVVYIITPKEREVFLRLGTDRERERFIEAFWKQRDPDPDTPDNEARQEHYRRIAYANDKLGRDTPGAGWRTPMGRIYIMLGEPKTIERFENTTELRPTVIWFYEGLSDLGLPSAFNVVFYKRDGVGDWVLYSPVSHGPQSLLVNSYGDPIDHYAAFQEILAIEPEVAGISLSLIPMESTLALSPSIASEVLLQSKIPAVPWEKVKDAYAEKFFKYKDSVGVEYTANYIESDFAVHVFRDASGVSFVHYIIEPKRLALERSGGRFHTTLQVNLIVSDLEGRPVHQGERSIPVDFSAEQVARIKDKLFSFQDLFPLIEGTYDLSVLVKNVLSKEFASAEARVTVTAPAGPEIGPLVLANKVVENSSYQGTSKPYLFGRTQLVPSPRGDFARADVLTLYFQALGVGPELRRTGRLRLRISDDAKTVSETTRPLADIPGLPDVLESIPLAALPPALYTLEAALVDGAGTAAASRQAGFYVSLAEVLPRPFVVSFPLPPAGDPAYDNILGNQYLNRKDLAGAGRRLEKAFRAAPSSPKFTQDYCKWLLAAGRFADLRRIAEPLLKEKDRHEFSGLLGQSAQAMGDCGAALAFYQDYLGHYGANINVMNSIGDCYLKLGRNAEALA
ncbi:MAG: GWxTD domain-containing protein, partial [Candidatus Aminicenantes bacterium]